MKRSLKDNGLYSNANKIMNVLHLVAVTAYLIVGTLVYVNVMNELFEQSKFEENKYIVLCIFD